MRMASLKAKVCILTYWYPSSNKPGSGIFVKEFSKTVSSFADVVVLHPLLDTQHLFKIIKIQETSITTYQILYGGFLARKWDLIQEKRRKRSLSMIDIIQKKMLSFFLLYLFYFIVVMRSFLAITRMEGVPHLIHAHVYKTCFPTMVVAKLLNIPVLLSVHASSFLTNKLTWLDLFLHVRMMKHCCRVLPVSGVLKRQINLLGIPNEKLEIVPNIVTMEQLHASKSEMVNVSQTRRERSLGRVKIGVITNFYENKGMDYLLRALSKLVEEDVPDFELLIAGTGEHQEKFLELTRALKLSSRVHFLGFIPHEQISEFFSQCDFYVLPSVIETFGISLVEALVFGLPVVATKVGIAPMVVTSRNGLLIPPANLSELVDALKLMLYRYESYDSNEIRESVKKFHPSIVMKKLRRIYFHCLTK